MKWLVYSIICIVLGYLFVRFSTIKRIFNNNVIFNVFFFTSMMFFTAATVLSIIFFIKLIFHIGMTW